MISSGIIKETSDGSATIYLPELDETYHSIHGAKQESNFVFVKEGLYHLLQNQPKKTENIFVFEIGFGTGLNALLFAENALELKQRIYFESIEKYPLNTELLNAFKNHFEENKLLNEIHEVEWNQAVLINQQFELKKIEADLLSFQFTQKSYFDLILMDAFAPDKQAEMWSLNIFTKLFEALKPGGILVTYSAKGDVKRAMRACGFIVKRIQGPPGKKHMLRAQKPIHETI